MATPNIVNVATINAVNSTALLDGTSRTEAVDVPADKVAKINTILIANVDGTNSANITIEVSIDNGSNYVKLANTIAVPADATLSFLENPIYLDETDLLYFTASAANDLTYFVSYELLDDAQEVLQAMANGGVIGPIQTVTAAACLSARVSTFNANGCFTAQATANADYLIVAGGGGGGFGSNGDGGGGGGAGGYRSTGFGPSPLRGSAVPVTKCTTYSIVVGAGGTPSATADNQPAAPGTGSNSSAFCVTSAGGGGGGPIGAAAANGGSGGGAGAQNGCAGSGNTPPTDPPQGQNGGTGSPGSASPNARGGAGGGATATGSPNAGAGGAGAPNEISGSDVTYAGGGGGGHRAPSGGGGSGGAGGGGVGAGSGGQGGNGSANTGGGGGGGGGSSGHDTNGGSGVVIIKEPAASVPASAPGVWNLSEHYNFAKAGEWTGF